MMATFRGGRGHDYGWLVQKYIDNGGAGMPLDVIPHFARVNTWSTDMRYSPGTIKLRDAKAFLDSAFEILNWADGRLS